MRSPCRKSTGTGLLVAQHCPLCAASAGEGWTPHHAGAVTKAGEACEA